MQDLKVTLVQANQVWENKIMNFENYGRLLNGIGPTDLIILPEMFHTSFSMNAESLNEKMEDSIGIEWLKNVAIKHQCAIYTSLIIKENNQFYNRGVFIYPDLKIVHYDKRKTFSLAGESDIFSSGAKPTIIEYKGWKVNLQICYDLRFPEVSLNKLDENGIPAYDLCIYVANWPEKRITHWNALLPARAIENQAYVVGVNRYGEDMNGLFYSGNSQVCSPLGDIEIELNNESVLTNILSFEQLLSVRLSLPFLKDRSIKKC